MCTYAFLFACTRIFATLSVWKFMLVYVYVYLDVYTDILGKTNILAEIILIDRFVKLLNICTECYWQYYICIFSAKFLFGCLHYSSRHKRFSLAIFIIHNCDRRANSVVHINNNQKNKKEKKEKTESTHIFQFFFILYLSWIFVFVLLLFSPFSIHAAIRLTQSRLFSWQRINSETENQSERLKVRIAI